MILWGGGDTVAWYQNSDRICVLRRSTLPLRVRLRMERDAALFFAFWRSEFHRVMEFSGVIGIRTPRVARGKDAAGG